MSKNSEFFTCQRVVNIMVFLGFLFHHMLRVNISIAIVEMVSKNDSNTTETTKAPRYNWNEEEKNDVLGYFFWGYMLTQIPGGRLSEKFGAKIVVGTGLLISSLATILTPAACYMNYYCLVAIRFILGVAMGIHWPSTPPIATKWIAPGDTSKFMSHLTASSLGVAMTLPACGYLIAYWGWPSVFYVTGTIALIWSLSWFYLIYDSPEEHPRITKEEKERLRNEIKIIKSTKKDNIPWISILTSAPAWAFIVIHTAVSFVFFVALNELSTYMGQILHFNIKQNGWLSGFPYLVRYFISVTSSCVADKLLQMEKFSVTTVRKIFTTSLFAGIGFLCAIQAIWGYSSIVSIAVFTGSFALIGLATPGIFTNCIDITPEYSGTLFGISQIPVSISGYISTKIVALLTKERQNFEQWTYVFWILVAVCVFALVFFLIFGSGEKQSWNSKNDELEMEHLQN